MAMRGSFLCRAVTKAAMIKRTTNQQHKKVLPLPWLVQLYHEKRRKLINKISKEVL
jgi:hypothetical protein